MLYLPPVFIALVALLAFVVGSCIGSFVNCAALRRETGESVLKGRSHCPHCGHMLGATELVPLFSWLVQKGTCKHCGHKLGVRYVVVEALCGLCFAALVVHDANSLMGISLLTLQNLILASLLLYISLVDLDSRTIPDWCIVAAIVLRAVYILLAGPVLGIVNAAAVTRFSLIGAFAIAIPLIVVVAVADRVFKRDSMGGGDLKLFFIAGLYFGWQQGMFLIIMACVLGIACALVEQRMQIKQAEQLGLPLEDASFEALRHKQIPFGPSIAGAMVLTMLVGRELVWWYAGLF